MGGHENLVQGKQNNRCANQAEGRGRCVFCLRGGGGDYSDIYAVAVITCIFWDTNLPTFFFFVLLVFWHSGSINNRDVDGRSQRKANAQDEPPHHRADLLINNSLPRQPIEFQMQGGTAIRPGKPAVTT